MQVFSPEGRILRKWGSEGFGDGQFESPFGIAVDASGNVYVADNQNNRVQVFSVDLRALSAQPIDLTPSNESSRKIRYWALLKGGRHAEERL